MSWWVKNVESFYRPPESAYTSKRATIICDTPQDLPAYNERQSDENDPFILMYGSDADVISNGRKYILNGSNEWIIQPQSGGSGGGSSEAVDINYDNSQSGLSATNVQDAIDETLVKDFPRFFICTCDTAAATAQKEVVCDDASFELKKGVTIAVKFSKSNTASNVSYSVNGTTPARIWYNNAIFTGSSNEVTGVINRYSFFIFDGTYWVWVNKGQYTSYSTMTQTEATAGTATTGRLISAKVLHDTIENRLVQPETAIADLYSITTKQEQEITYSIDTGAKNRLLNTQTPGTYTIRDVDFTVLADGTIEVSPGTVTGGNADLSINASVDGLEVGEKYVLTGCPAGGSTSGYRLNISGVGADTGDGLEFLYEGTAINVYLRISNNYVIDSALTFKPMIRRVEIKGTAFEPYAPTNRELYEMILALQDGRSLQSVNPTSTLNLRRNDLNESLDSNFDLLDSIPEEEEGELE